MRGLVASGAQAIGLLGLVLLYYFDLRREAGLAATGLLLVVTVFTLAASATGLPPSFGTALGCFLGTVNIWRHVFHKIGALLEHTLLARPFGIGRRRARRRDRERSVR